MSSPPIMGTVGASAAAPAGAIALTDHTVNGINTLPNHALARAQFTSAGVLNLISSGAGTVPVSGEWQDPHGWTPGAGFDIMAEHRSGSTPSGDPLGVWLSLSSDRYWEVSRAGTTGTVSSALIISIRDASSLKVQASATITLQATLLL